MELDEVGEAYFCKMKNYITINEAIAEVSTILVQTATTTPVTCKIRFSVPKQSADKAGTFTITKN